MAVGFRTGVKLEGLVFLLALGPHPFGVARLLGLREVRLQLLHLLAERLRVLPAPARFRDLLLQRVHGLGVRLDDLVRLVILEMNGGRFRTGVKHNEKTREGLACAIPRVHIESPSSCAGRDEKTPGRCCDSSAVGSRAAVQAMLSCVMSLAG